MSYLSGAALMVNLAVIALSLEPWLQWYMFSQDVGNDKSGDKCKISGVLCPRGLTLVKLPVAKPISDLQDRPSGQYSTYITD